MRLDKQKPAAGVLQTILPYQDIFKTLVRAVTLCAKQEFLSDVLFKTIYLIYY